MIPRAQLWPLLLAALPLAPLAEEARLQVLLQGESAAELRALTSKAGGEVTHFLPIINAIGAELTRQELEFVLRSGKVARHIDDLRVDPDDSQAEEEQPACDVGGSLQYQFDERGYRWPLFNKGEQAVALQEVSLSWPDSAGKLLELRLGDTALDTSAATAGALTLALKPGAVVLRDKAMLSARFSQASPLLTSAHQGSFSSRLSFGPDCEVQSVAAYPDNHENFQNARVTEADSLHAHGIRGQGITVAILDSGLWETDPLATDTSGQPRVPARYDAITDAEGSETFDESGHGTHLASVLAHSGPTLRAGTPDGSYKGIAPDVRIVPVKAFNVDGQGDLLDIVRGVQWVVDNRERLGIRVMNLSFASRPRWPYWLDPVNQAVMRAWQAGIVVIAAAGNEGPEQMTIGSPGNLPYIITVGAVTDSWTPEDRSDDYVPDFSSRGPTPAGHIKPDLVAPGGHMTGLTRPGSTLLRQHPEYQLATGEFVMTGSSQAAALVSGLAALLLQLDPDLTPDEVKCMLTTSAEPAINRDGLLAYSPFQQGHGYVSISRAITIGERGCGNAGLDLARDLANQEHFEGPAIVTESGEASLPGLPMMLSPQTPEQGRSTSRVWGAKAHIERLPGDDPAASPGPLDWIGQYHREREQMEQLQRRNGA